MFNVDKNQLSRQTGSNMISVASEKNISTAKKRDIAPFKVNGQPHIILQQLSCGTRSKVSFVSNPAQISRKHAMRHPMGTSSTTYFRSEIFAGVKNN
jgi:hypothetical protein